MKIELYELPVQALEHFADEHNLIMVIRERERPERCEMRYYACFKDVKVIKTKCSKSSFLCNESSHTEDIYGLGLTLEGAIQSYASKISFQTLALNSSGSEQKVIKAPRLYWGSANNFDDHEIKRNTCDSHEKKMNALSGFRTVPGFTNLSQKQSTPKNEHKTRRDQQASCRCHH